MKLFRGASRFVFSRARIYRWGVIDVRDRLALRANVGGWLRSPRRTTDVANEMTFGANREEMLGAWEGAPSYASNVYRASETFAVCHAAFPQ